MTPRLTLTALYSLMVGFYIRVGQYITNLIFFDVFIKRQAQLSPPIIGDHWKNRQRKLNDLQLHCDKTIQDREPTFGSKVPKVSSKYS